MQLVERAIWRAVRPRGDYVQVVHPAGVKIHWTGGRYDSRSHAECAAYLRGIQSFHMDSRGWMDIAYNLMCCQHGYVFVGRGARHRNAANGDEELNAMHYAVLVMVGNSGLIEPTPSQLGATVDAIELLRATGGAGAEVKGHSDGYATDCPGPALSAWIAEGALRPGTINPDMTFPGAGAFHPGVMSLAAEWAQKALNARGYPCPLSCRWDEASIDACKVFQRHQGWGGLGADGKVGPMTWERLMVGFDPIHWCPPAA